MWTPGEKPDVVFPLEALLSVTAAVSRIFKDNAIKAPSA